MVREDEDPAPDEGTAIWYEVIQGRSEREAWRQAQEAALAGLQRVTVTRRPAAVGPVWGYRFQARPAASLWVIEDDQGRWLSEEWAANPVEALAIYHATGGVSGFLARGIRVGSALGCR